MQLKSLGAGNPDGGLFTSDQFDRKTGESKDLGKPSRGVIEVKSPSEPVDDIATSNQIAKYWGRYKLVLVTNLREWLLLGERLGKRVTLERFSLASDEATFWATCGHPSTADAQLGKAFEDFLSRVLTHNAPLADPQDLAALLASYAREARHRVEHAAPTAAKQLQALQNSLENSLGLTFSKDEGGHFFRSTLVQTLFYGIFSAWVLRREQSATGEVSGPFDWRSAAHSLKVPMIAALFSQLSQPSRLKALNLIDVLDWASDALNRVDQEKFFKTFESTRSIQYFYEPFLAAFDPKLRKSLGVWYTPEEIVKYQVDRVDQVLQTELGLSDGLADPNVIVLDPCCGTGTYLVEVLRLIAERLKSQGADALIAHQLKLAATTRLFGFELLPAPYVVAHLQLGLILRQWGAPLGVGSDGNDERASVYLTNALTGWEPAKEPKSAVLPFPEFEEERDAADHVKQTQKIIVILGNPPYDAYGGVALGEESDLVTPYKTGLVKKWGVKKFNLDDLYIRFFRLAERRIAEQTGRGVVCLITNSFYISGDSFTVMREHLLGNFDRIWIDNLNGDSRETGKLTPEGQPDPSVFSTPYNREGIKKGTAVALLVCNHAPGILPAPQTYHREWWGTGKRKALLESAADEDVQKKYQLAQPTASNRFSFRPGKPSSEYASWPTISEIAAIPLIHGPVERRAEALIDIDRERLAGRMKLYFDSSVAADAMPSELRGLNRISSGFEPHKVRSKALKQEKFNSELLQPYLVRPFDRRWCYFANSPGIWSRPSKPLEAHCGDNYFLGSRPSGVIDPEGFPLILSSVLPDYQAITRNISYAPLVLKVNVAGDLLGAGSSTWQPNLSQPVRQYLSKLGFASPESDRDVAEAVWLHALAIGYSPLYISTNRVGLKENWPRIPLPSSRDALYASARLGREIAMLLDSGSALPGVTTGAIRPDLRMVGAVNRLGGGALLPDEFTLTAGWGSEGKGGIVMPGKGHIERRPATTEEYKAEFGPTTLDVYLNSAAYWKNIPVAVWEFTIGGYQVMKKWLSYREARVIGRPLTMPELMEVTAMARRLAALVQLQPKLDANYEAAADSTASLEEGTP